MFFQRGNRVGHGHCGLIIYIHETFLSQEVIIENDNTSWDYLCAQLSHSSPNSKKNLLDSDSDSDILFNISMYSIK